MGSHGRMGGNVRLALRDMRGQVVDRRELHNAFTDAYAALLGKALANTLSPATLPLTHLSVGCGGVTVDTCDAIGGAVSAVSAVSTVSATGTADLLALQPADPSTAPALVGTSTGSYSGTSYSTTVPAWASSTYILYVVVGVGSYTQHAASNPTAAGFTLIRNMGKTWIYGAFKNALSASWVEAWTGTMAFTWAFIGYSGCDPTTPVLVENGQTTAASTTHTTPALTGVCSNATLVATFTEDTTTQASWTPPGSMTERVDTNIASRPPIGIADSVLVVGGWSGSPTLDSTVFRQGTASFSKTVSPSSSVSLTGPAMSPAKDLSAQAYIEVLVRVDSRAKLDLTGECVRLTTSTGNYYAAHWADVETYLGTPIPDGAWVRADIPLAAFTATGSPSWASITRLSLSATATGAGTLSVWWDAVLGVPSSLGVTPAIAAVPNEVLKVPIGTLSEPSTGKARSAATLTSTQAVGTLRALGLYGNGGTTLAAVVEISPPLEKTSLLSLDIEWDASVVGS